MKKTILSLAVILVALTVSVVNHPILAADKISLTQLQQGATTQQGFIDIIFDVENDKLYLKIDQLDQELIYQTSLPSGLGSNDIGLDRGQLGTTRLVVFERAGNKLFLKQKPVNFRAITDNQTEAAAIDEAFASSILWGFKIEDSGDDWVLVDASEFLLQDIHGVGRVLASQKQGVAYKVDHSRSAVDSSRTKAFPENTELQATITLLGTEPGNFVRDTAPDPHAITLKMHHSFIRLPDDGYQARVYHPKSGFWSVQYQDYAQPINSDINQQLIGRHRLQKQHASAVQSEAIEPIVYYVDPGVPEPIRSALIEGASWWNQAFEAAGYTDAFQVKVLPLDADPMDVRYNVIQWVHRATRGWSYGSSVIDPRTGEIIKGHVTLGSLRVRQDYLIAQGMLAPFGNDGGGSIDPVESDDKDLMRLALARIRQLSAHEVGHTLGLNHNFAASNYGRESVMDYPHPQFELEDGPDGKRVIAPQPYGIGLGKWDIAAVAYGYTEYNDTQGKRMEGEQVAKQLASLIESNDVQGLLYISDADARSPGSPHADASLWDNGQDAVEELEKMKQIRSVAMAKFGADNLRQGRNWSDLEEIFVPLYYSNRFQIQAAAKWLSGSTYDYSVKKSADDFPLFKMVSPEKQFRAMDALISTLSPEYLSISPEVSSLLVPKAVENSRTRESVNGQTGVVLDQIYLASALAQHTIGLLFNPQRLARLHQQHALDSQVPSIAVLGQALFDRVVEPKTDGMQAAIHQSVVDLIISNYLNLLSHKDVSRPVKMQIAALVAQQKMALKKMSKSVNSSSSYRGFYDFQYGRLDDLSMDRQADQIPLPSMPPGSPI